MTLWWATAQWEISRGWFSFFHSFKVLSVFIHPLISKKRTQKFFDKISFETRKEERKINLLVQPTHTNIEKSEKSSVQTWKLYNYESWQPRIRKIVKMLAREIYFLVARERNPRLIYAPSAHQILLSCSISTRADCEKFRIFIDFFRWF